jgi:hypothetical protein
MSPGMVKTGIVVILASLCNLAACVAQIPPCPPMTPPGQTELDKAYYYSTINQEMVYARLRQNQAFAASTSTRSMLLPMDLTTRPCLPARPVPSVISSAPTSGVCPAPSPALRGVKHAHHWSRAKHRACRRSSND